VHLVLELPSLHKVDIEAEQEFIANDTVQKEVKLMRVRGQRHGASLPRGHEEVKSSMHANIDGFKTEMAKVKERWRPVSLGLGSVRTPSYFLSYIQLVTPPFPNLNPNLLKPIDNWSTV
jgi:hypothetical protein